MPLLMEIFHRLNSTVQLSSTIKTLQDGRISKETNTTRSLWLTVNGKILLSEAMPLLGSCYKQFPEFDIRKDPETISLRSFC